MENKFDVKPFNSKSVNVLYFLFLLSIPVGYLSGWVMLFMLIGIAIAAKVFQDKGLSDEQNGHYKFQVKTFWGYLFLNILAFPVLIGTMYLLGKVSFSTRYGFNPDALLYALSGLSTYFMALTLALFAYLVVRVLKGIKASNAQQNITGGVFSLGKIHS